MFGHNVHALNCLSSCLRSLLTSLSWFRKYLKVKHHDKKINFAFQWKTLYFEQPWKRPRFVFVFLSGEMKQFSLLRNYWDLLSIYRNLIYLWFLCQFEQQPEGKTLFKSKFSHELGEMKENIFTIVQMMTAYLWSWLWTVKQQDILLIIIEYYRDAFNTNSHYKTCAVLLVVLGIIIFNEINITALVPL